MEPKRVAGVVDESLEKFNRRREKFAAEAEKWEKELKSVKRGRSDSTGSPPERPPTPGGAKLGD